MVDGVPGPLSRTGAPAGIAAPAPREVRGAAAAGHDFLAALEHSQLEFSRHALKRIEQRGLQLDAPRLDRLEQAVDRAEAKGARDSLILLDELALVVSVQNRTVLTAMDESSRKEHVFTNIDSVVIAD
jgi:flagellar operon protein